MRLFWLDADQAGISVSDMPRLGLGSPWGRVELKDVRVPAELVNDLSMLVKHRELER